MALQILIPLPEQSPLVVTMPAALRVARAAERAGLGPVYLGTRDRAFAARWSGALSRIPGAGWLHLNGHPGLPEGLDPDAPVLLVAPNSAGALPSSFQPSQGAAVWARDGAAAAAYYPSARSLDGKPWEKIGSTPPSRFADAGTPIHSQEGPELLDGPASVRSAEKRLLESLRGGADGYLARYDRAVSTRLSSWLCATPVTPNQITSVSLLLSLIGAWELAFGAYGACLAGAALLWFAAILDGCDGEVARLTFQSSPAGASYDLFADHVAHAAAFAAIVARVALHGAPGAWLAPAWLLASGVGACMFVMWFKIRRLPAARRNKAAVVFQRLGSRDYVYLIVAAAALGRLDWLFWGAALGSHLFWLAVLVLA